MPTCRTLSKPGPNDGARQVVFLRQAVGDATSGSVVDVIETHKSWVFRGDQFVYKLKKAIRYDSIDFRDPNTRRRNCVEEVRLNQRLAPGVYLGVVPLTLESGGELALGGSGNPIDWLVKMRRLPDELFLDRKITDGSVTPEEIRRVAEILARFYQTAAPPRIDGERYRSLLRREIEINRRDLLADVRSLETQELIDAQIGYLERHSSQFDRRVADGQVVEGHGDLRPEHICLDTVPVVIDCLEFSAELRIVDAVDELAFLGLHCERLGAGWIGDALLDVYRKVSGDKPPDSLIRFHESYRSTTWARLAVWRAREIDGDARRKWLERSDEYLRLAQTRTKSLS